MKRLIYDGDTLVGTEDDGLIKPEKGPSGALLVEWLEKGVPGLRGEQQFDLMVEVPITVKPDDPLFGLALLEEFERRNWTVRADAHLNKLLRCGRWVKAGEWDEGKHSRDDRGRFSSGGGEYGISALSSDPESGGKPLYRGTREGSRAEGYTFWTPEKDYAESYADEDTEIQEAYLVDQSKIFDMTELIKDGDIDGADIDAAIPGLADALGIDNETVIEMDRLWDAAGEDLSNAVKILEEHGYAGFRWRENEGNEAYLLIHDRKHWVSAKEWSEESHPRDDRGRFGHGGSEPIKEDVDALKAQVSEPKSREDLLADDPHETVWRDADPAKSRYGTVVVNPENGKVLLREPAGHFDGYNWTFSKGGRDEGEHPLETAERETREEMGIEATVVKPIPKVFRNEGGKWNCFYLATSTQENSGKTDKETKSTRWATYKEAQDLIRKTTNAGGRARDLRILAAAYGRTNAAGKGLVWLSFKEWAEEQHPRDEHGRFISGGSGEGTEEDASESRIMLAPDTGGPVGGGATVKPLAEVKIIDISKWPAHNTTAQWGAKKIAMLEKLFAEGKYEELKAIDCKPKGASSPSTYTKGVYTAWQALVNKIGDQAIQDPPQSEPTKVEVAAGALDANDWQNVGGQLGSNPGGTYLAEDGTKYYCKFPGNDAVARNEVLTGKLYELASGNVANYQLIEKDGNLGVASEWMTGTMKPDWSDLVQKEIAQKDFAVHAWLANWDVIGTGGTTNLEFSNGKAVVVDAGGGLEYRAQGGPKGDDFKKEAIEWDTLRNQSVNPNAAKVFGAMTEQQLLDSAKVVSGIKTADITKLVNKYHGGTAVQKSDLVNKLVARRDYITKRAKELKESYVAKLEAEAEKLGMIDKPAPKVKPPPKPAQAPSATPTPVSTPTSETKPTTTSVPPTIPPPPVITSKSNASHQNKLNKIYAAALTGDVAAVEAIPTNADTKHTYSSKVHAYKLTVLSAMESGGQTHPDHAKAVEAATKAEKQNKPPKIDPGKFPEKPEFVSSNKANVDANNSIVAECLKHAEAGDIDALKSVALSPSPKLQAWHASLVSEVHQQLHPPEPLKTVSGKLADIAKALPTVKVSEANAPRVGRYLELGNVGGIPSDVKSASTHCHPDWDHGHKVYESLSASQQKALKAYTDGAYSKMNAELSSGNPSSTTKTAAQAISDHAIPLPEGMLLSRNHSFDNSHDFEKLKQSVGKVLQDPGIGSSSSKPTTFAHHSVHWKLTIGPGVKGLPIDTDSSVHGEKEVLQVPGYRILVTKVEQVKSNPHESGAVKCEGILLPTLPWKG